CRCTGYHNIVKAILAAAQTMSKGAKGKAKQAA
ncbi:(2Fe-2S)-binding protein, partial [Mesorhizobium sp. M2D.F.Ca.ET.223.01.1.1]